MDARDEAFVRIVAKDDEHLVADDMSAVTRDRRGQRARRRIVRRLEMPSARSQIEAPKFIRDHRRVDHAAENIERILQVCCREARGQFESCSLFMRARARSPCNEPSSDRSA